MDEVADVIHEWLLAYTQCLDGDEHLIDVGTAPFNIQDALARKFKFVPHQKK